ncbi:transmembrane protein 53-like isoform X2 [Watersipora subatra]|uniref:transmembrane protein 53-like isoform X2 n=1 Tax=Watersipora subatra TaxID=2589382 RepID=UPI00355C3C70
MAKRSLKTYVNSAGIRFEYRRVTLDETRQRQDYLSPLVLFLPWLGAQKKHIDKYADFYHDRSYDVLVTPSIRARDFLFPQKSFNLAKCLVDELRKQPYAERPLIFHSWSVGSYILAVIYFFIKTSPKEYADISERVIGCVADSITIGSTSRMCTGIAENFAKGRPLFKLVITQTLAAYFYLTHSSTVKVYEEFVDAFQTPPLPHTPLLYFYSLNDPMSDPVAIAQLIAEQKEKGYTVFHRSWEVSAHTQHMLHHPQEYKSTLKKFLMTIDPGNKLFLRAAL